MNEVRLDIHFDRLTESLAPAIQRGLKRGGEEVRIRCQALAPRDTTSLVQSVYVGDAGGSDYGEASSAAQSVNPGVKLAGEERAGPNEVVVGIAVAHGLPVEVGTARSAAQPSLGPALELSRDAILAAVADEVRKALA